MVKKNKKSKDTFRILPAELPHKRRIERMYPKPKNGQKKQCWILDLDEIKDLYEQLKRLTCEYHKDPKL